MRASATVLSNNILIRAKRDNIKITPMKLQKLLYYTCVKYVKETGELPISEHFEVWKYGPVIPAVYSEFRPFGSSAITSYSKNAKGKSKMVDEDCNPILSSCIDYVWRKYKNLTGIELSKKTHQEGSGWFSAFQKDNATISKEEMQKDGTI